VCSCCRRPSGLLGGRLPALAEQPLTIGIRLMPRFRLPQLPPKHFAPQTADRETRLVLIFSSFVPCNSLGPTRSPPQGRLRPSVTLVHDRDPLFTKKWKLLLASSGVSSVSIPAQSPNCNPHAERFIKSIRNECLDHFIVFGEPHLRHLVREYVAHYNAERYHQGIGGKLLTKNALAANDNNTTASVEVRSRLAGTLNFYHREVA